MIMHATLFAMRALADHAVTYPHRGHRDKSLRRVHRYLTLPWGGPGTPEPGPRCVQSAVVQEEDCGAAQCCTMLKKCVSSNVKRAVLICCHGIITALPGD
jgi:hypothetical protein